MRMEESAPGEVLERDRSIVRSHQLTIAEQERVRGMQRLANAPDRQTYLALQQEIAEQLDMTVRNVRHLMRGWQAEGVSGVIRRGRSDRREQRLDEEWRDYILQTYRAGNRGGRRMSRAQVAVRVAARAEAVGESQPPSRMTVYRVLQSEIVVCLALRHVVLPKQYSSSYELIQAWGTYGLPRYSYTDGGKDFQSKHLEQVASELKIVLCRRRCPAEGGIVERPFGTLNSELFMTLPGYTGNTAKRRPKQAESSASLTLIQLERYIVRYLVERYNPGIDARIGDQTRLGRWEVGSLAQLPILSNRELDICLMRRGAFGSAELCGEWCIEAGISSLPT